MMRATTNASGSWNANSRTKPLKPYPCLGRSVGASLVKALPLLIAGALITIVGGGFAYTVWAQGRCPGHWHATFVVYVDDHRVSFNDPEFYLEGNPRMPISSHVHSGRDFVFHFEPNPSKCVLLGDSTKYVGMTWTDNALSLVGDHNNIQLEGTTHNQGGTYAADANHTLAFFHKLAGESWEQTTGSELNGRQLRDGEKVLVLYGNYSADRIAKIEAGVPIPPEYSSAHPGVQ